MIEIIFLGTSCMQPTKERNHPGVLLTYEGENILFDCGEGIQRQMKIAGIKPAKITKLLITHWHGDHVLGIPGLMQTMGASEYEKKLHIYGPEGTKEYIKNMMKAFVSEGTIDFEVHEVKERIIFENDMFILECLPLQHATKTVGYSFIEKDKRRINTSYVKKLGIPDGPLLGKLQNGKDIEWKGKKISADDATIIVKGKKVSYVLDTMICNNAVELAKDADLLICEASYTKAMRDKAEEYKHLTGEEAATIANRANVKELYLTHFSQRYKNTDEIEENAKDVFPNVKCAKDFMKVKL